MSPLFDSLSDIDLLLFGLGNAGVSASLASIPVQIASSISDTLYFSLSFLSLTPEVAPPACPRVGEIQPDNDASEGLQA